VKAYDPRLDSTQTGGSGAQRALTESTYVYSQNPWVHAETYALGRWQNSKIVIGPGLPADKIDFAPTWKPPPSRTPTAGKPRA
jgi:hypothetical protein